MTPKPPELGGGADTTSKPVSRERFPPGDPVAGQILGSDPAAVGGHVLGQQAGSLAPVEILRSGVANALERGGKFRLPPAFTGRNGGEVFMEVCSAREARGLVGDVGGQQRWNPESVPGQLDGGCQ